MAPRKKRGVKKDHWTDEEHLFSEKSKLIHVDLHSYFANPKAWEVLTEIEKEELLALLPPHIALNDEGLLPQDFLKYDNDWRNALRQFQVDLEAGRYDADWLNEAALAMEERAAGDFDNWKEEEFEEFWGQKQKIPHDVLAGEMTTLKLEVLVKAGVFRVGDVWSYSRGFGRGKQSTLVEKDVTIIAIESGKLTFSIPPGQYKYLIKKQNAQSEVSSDTAMSSDPPAEAIDSQKGSSGESKEARSEADRGSMESKEPCKEDHNIKTPPKRRSEDKDEIIKPRKKVVLDHPKGKDEVDFGNGETTTPSMESPDDTLDAAPLGSSKVAQVRRNSNDITTNATPEKVTLTVPSQDEICNTNDSHENPTFLPNGDCYEEPTIIAVNFPQALENKILEVDGRCNGSKRNSNAWKTIRCKRDNQDMGSLWEIREEYYVRKLSL